MSKEIRDSLINLGCEDSIILTEEFDGAIIGIDALNNRLIYDYNKMVMCLMREHDWEQTEAMEWIDYNTIASLSFQEDFPIIMFPLEE